MILFRFNSIRFDSFRFVSFRFVIIPPCSFFYRSLIVRCGMVSTQQFKFKKIQIQFNSLQSSRDKSASRTEVHWVSKKLNINFNFISILLNHWSSWFPLSVGRCMDWNWCASLSFHWIELNWPPRFVSTVENILSISSKVSISYFFVSFLVFLLLTNKWQTTRNETLINSLHHITSHHITSHHITSHHITLHYITSDHITIRTIPYSASAL